MGNADDQEDTPLHEAVRYSDIADTKDALKKGCDPNKIGLYQWSALHEAVHNGDVEIVRLLLRHGGDPNKPDLLQECTALHYAASRGHLQCLRLLLDSGAKWDIKDTNEKTSLDVANGDCISALRQLTNTDPQSEQSLKTIGYNFDKRNDHDGRGDKELLSKCCSRENLEKVILENTQHDFKGETRNNAAKWKTGSEPSGNNMTKGNPRQRSKENEITVLEDSRSTSDVYSLEDNRLVSSKGSDTSSIVKSDCTSGIDSTLDPDEVSLTSLDSLDYGLYTSSFITPKAWTRDGPVVGVGRKLVLGNILLSFEYNSKKSTFKIRVWQVTDLLMPPVETSMISGIYVKSYLLPDKRKDFKRKTEELPVYSSAEKARKISDNSQTSEIFKPSSFSFTKAPEYKKVTSAMVKDKIVHLEVCTVQKYTRRSFVFATFNMPMAEAVKNLVKQRYPLTPRISTEVPENMKIYDGTDLKVSHQKPYRSFPNTRVPSASSLENNPERSSSDSNLKRVKVHDMRPASSIEITVPSDERDINDLEHDLQQIRIMEKREADQWTSIPMTITDSDDELDNVSHTLSTIQCEVHEVAVHLPIKAKHDHSQSYSNPAFDWKTSDIKPDTDDKKKRKFSLRKPSFTSAFKKDKDKNSKRDSGISNSSRESFRAETPSFLWDDYMEPLQTTMDPVTFDDDFGFEMDGPVLPMTTSLDMPLVHGNSFYRPDGVITTCFIDQPHPPEVSITAAKEELAVQDRSPPKESFSESDHISVFVTEPELDGIDENSNLQTKANVFDANVKEESTVSIPEEISLSVVNEMLHSSIKVSPKDRTTESVSGPLNLGKRVIKRKQTPRTIETAKTFSCPRMDAEFQNSCFPEDDMETIMI